MDRLGSPCRIPEFVKLAKGIVRHRSHVVASTAGIDSVDLLRWIASWPALSGIWHLEDGNDALASFPHSIRSRALDRLRTYGESRSD